MWPFDKPGGTGAYSPATSAPSIKGDPAWEFGKLPRKPGEPLVPPKFHEDAQAQIGVPGRAPTPPQPGNVGMRQPAATPARPAVPIAEAMATASTGRWGGGSPSPAAPVTPAPSAQEVTPAAPVAAMPSVAPQGVPAPPQPGIGVNGQSNEEHTTPGVKQPDPIEDRLRANYNLWGPGRRPGAWNVGGVADQMEAGSLAQLQEYQRGQSHVGLMNAQAKSMDPMAPLGMLNAIAAKPELSALFGALHGVPPGGMPQPPLGPNKTINAATFPEWAAQRENQGYAEMMKPGANWQDLVAKLDPVPEAHVRGSHVQQALRTFMQQEHANPGDWARKLPAGGNWLTESAWRAWSPREAQSLDRSLALLRAMNAEPYSEEEVRPYMPHNKFGY